MKKHTIYGTFFENRIVVNFSYLQEHVRISDNGSLNNCVDQILPNFDPHPPLQWTKMDILHTIYPLQREPHVEFLLTPAPLLLSM